jgi:hypothetical protein
MFAWAGCARRHSTIRLAEFCAIATNTQDTFSRKSPKFGRKRPVPRIRHLFRRGGQRLAAGWGAC